MKVEAGKNSLFELFSGLVSLSAAWETAPSEKIVAASQVQTKHLVQANKGDYKPRIHKERLRNAPVGAVMHSAGRMC